ncbi:Unknown protein [Striga hermonthica]|uniref:Uncharacterized protein n=1 Tax=Striga hermonthica TaxID=68872 RepID=A0A9N7N2A6_STRHE|nr:Unknown protein [Striga hermonthica]
MAVPFAYGVVRPVSAPWIRSSRCSANPFLPCRKGSFSVSRNGPYRWESTLQASLHSTLSEEDRSDLVNALKDKLSNLAGQHAEVMEKLTPNVRKCVEVLREIQGQHDELEAKFLEERAALEAKYQKLYETLYTKRFEIVNGVVEVEGVTDASADQGNDKANKDKGVPDFWLAAMKTNEILAEGISERDEEALKFLKDIKWARIDDPKGFKLEFFFDTNPFFKNTVLTKTYHMVDEDEPILEKAIGTQIEWYPGKCLTQKILKKKPKKGVKNAKPITKTEKCESFFNFFSPPEVPEDEEDIDEDVAEELQNLMEQDYDIGSTIRDKIIPHAVSWFTGEAAQDDELDMMEDNDGDDNDHEDDDDDDDDDEEEDDDEDDDEDEAPVKFSKKPSRPKRGVAGRAGEGPLGERPAECNQQSKMLENRNFQVLSRIVFTNLCKEAHKSKFLWIRQPHDPNIRKEIETQRRICFDDSTINEEFDFGSVQSSSLRSLIWPLGTGTINLRCVNCKLLRVLTVVAYNTCDPPDYLSANMRFLEFFCTNIHRVASSFLSFLCQELMSLNQDPNPTRLVDIWKMTA